MHHPVRHRLLRRPRGPIIQVQGRGPRPKLPQGAQTVVRAGDKVPPNSEDKVSPIIKNTLSSPNFVKFNQVQTDEGQGVQDGVCAGAPKGRTHQVSTVRASPAA